MKKAVRKTIKTKKIERDEISELRKLSYIFGSIVIVFLLFFGIAYIKTFDKSKEYEDTTGEIQYEEILAGNILKQNYDNYYVLAYNKEEDYNGIYTPYIKKYKNNENALQVFYVNLNNTFNQGFKNDTNNFTIKNILELKIKDDVLFLIKNGKIDKYYVGEQIAEILNK